MFEDCAAIFAGYGTVDHIVTKCEKIAVSLRKEIAKWTDGGDVKGKGREGSVTRGSPAVSDMDGALSLRSQAALSSDKPDYYISTQPTTLSSDVQLKDYQMIGINWLNLLYIRKLSCILADEMGMYRKWDHATFCLIYSFVGLGKTVQVISFFAHLKATGCKGPHLIVVPQVFMFFVIYIVLTHYSLALRLWKTGCVNFSGLPRPSTFGHIMPIKKTERSFGRSF